MVDRATIDNILNDFSKFTKEEYEIVNTYQTKSLASYDLQKYDLLRQTEPKYFQSNILLSKYGDLAMKHKEMVISTQMEHLQVHKEILLQLLAILQSLVQNPNLLDTLLSLLNSEWYSGQDFKKFISGLINEEMNHITQLYIEINTLINKPLMCFLPELYDEENPFISTTNLKNFYETLRKKYVLEP